MTNRFNFDSDEDKRFIPDTSVIINGRLKTLVKENYFTAESEIIIHAALLAELEHQANEEKKNRNHWFDSTQGNSRTLYPKRCHVLLWG